MTGRVGWLLSVPIAATALSLWTNSTPVGAASTIPASQMVSVAIHDAEESGWVHEVTNATGQGHVFSMVNDIGTTEGRQVIISDGAHAEVIVLNGDAYIYGDEKAVANYFEVSRTDPQTYANRWLEITPSNPDFSTVSAAVTLASDFGGQVAMGGALTEGPARVLDGVRVLAIRGRIPATAQSPAGNATLYVTTSGRILPFEYQVTGKGVESTTRWTDWGRGVRLATPSSTPLAG